MVKNTLMSCGLTNKEKKHIMEERLYDKNGHLVRVGDKVVYLYKTYGYRKIADVQLVEGKYLGKGQWGHEFSYPGMDTSRYSLNSPIRIKEPDCLKLG